MVFGTKFYTKYDGLRDKVFGTIFLNQCAIKRKYLKGFWSDFFNFYLEIFLRKKAWSNHLPSLLDNFLENSNLIQRQILCSNASFQKPLNKIFASCFRVNYPPIVSRMFSVASLSSLSSLGSPALLLFLEVFGTFFVPFFTSSPALPIEDVFEFVV